MTHRRDAENTEKGLAQRPLRLCGALSYGFFDHLRCAGLATGLALVVAKSKTPRV